MKAKAARIFTYFMTSYGLRYQSTNINFALLWEGCFALQWQQSEKNRKALCVQFTFDKK